MTSSDLPIGRGTSFSISDIDSAPTQVYHTCGGTQRLLTLVGRRMRISCQVGHWPSSVGGKQQGPTMATFLVLFLLALALTPSSGGGSSATGVTSGCFPNMNFKVFSHQGQRKDALDHLLIKSLWMIRKVICSVNMYIVHLVVCTFCVFHYIQQCFGGTVYIIHNNQTTLLR